jgi:hypothetical protein
MTVDMVPVVFDAASKVTLEGFEFTKQATPTDALTVRNGAADVHIVKNSCHDQWGAVCVWIEAQTTTISNLLIQGNHFYHLFCTTDGINTSDCSGGGYGMYGCLPSGSGHCSGLRVTYNTMEVGVDPANGNKSKSRDNAEIGACQSCEFDHNVLRGVNNISAVNPACTDTTALCNPHADTFMIWGGSTNASVHDNRVESGTDFQLTGDDNNLSLVNNLIVAQTDQACVDANHAPQPVGWTVQQNTIYGCTGGPGFNMDSTSSAGGNLADRNLIQSLAGCNTAAWTNNDHHNLLGDSSTCWPGATNQTAFTPSWADTSNVDSSDYYRPTNLPGGFSDAGYQYTPAGYTNCGC